MARNDVGHKSCGEVPRVLAAIRPCLQHKIYSKRTRCNSRITRRTGNIGFSSCPWQSDLLANQLDSLEVLFDTRGCPISRYVALVWVPLCKTGWNRAVFALFFLSRLCHASLYQVYQTAESLFLWKNLSLVSQANQLIHTSCIERW